MNNPYIDRASIQAFFLVSEKGRVVQKTYQLYLFFTVFHKESKI
jgi:hypothetical protein